jgi:hypothetical protein
MLKAEGTKFGASWKSRAWVDDNFLGVSATDFTSEAYAVADAERRAKNAVDGVPVTTLRKDITPNL